MKIDIVVYLLVLCLPVIRGRLTINPQEIVAVKGDRVECECTTDSHDYVSWDFRKYSASMDPIWLGQGKGSPNSSGLSYRRIRKAQGHFVLVIESVDRSHAGVYICQEGFRLVSSITAELTVIDPDPKCSVITLSNGGVLMSSLFVILKCSFDYYGKIAPIVRWTQANDNDANTLSSTECNSINGKTQCTAIVMPNDPDNSRSDNAADLDNHHESIVLDFSHDLNNCTCTWTKNVNVSGSRNRYTFLLRDSVKIGLLDCTVTKDQTTSENASMYASQIEHQPQPFEKLYGWFIDNAKAAYTIAALLGVSIIVLTAFVSVLAQSRRQKKEPRMSRKTEQMKKNDDMDDEVWYEDIDDCLNSTQTLVSTGSLNTAQQKAQPQIPNEYKDQHTLSAPEPVAMIHGVQVHSTMEEEDLISMTSSLYCDVCHGTAAAGEASIYDCLAARPATRRLPYTLVTVITEEAESSSDSYATVKVACNY